MNLRVAVVSRGNEKPQPSRETVQIKVLDIENKNANSIV